jgi:hypothetical protein
MTFAAKLNGHVFSRTVGQCGVGGEGQQRRANRACRAASDQSSQFSNHWALDGTVIPTYIPSHVPARYIS